MYYQFDGFTLCPATRLLRRDTVAIDAPRRVLDCLVHLIEHRERAVSRDELIAQVWKRSNVSDNQLAQTIAAVRRLVADDGNRQRLVRTVAGFGYHWVGLIEVIHDGNGSEPAPITDALDTADGVPQTAVIGRRWARPRLFAAAAALLLSAAALATWWSLTATEPLPAAAGTGQTWVLPAELPEEGEAWARVGLMALVADGLRRQGSSVVPVETVLAHANDLTGSKPLSKLVQSLAAEHVVVPRLRHTGGAWVVELIAVDRAGSELRAEASDGDLLSAGRTAVQRLNQKMGRWQVDQAGEPSAAFAVIQQAIRMREFESALLLLSRLPDDLLEHAETRLLEIELDLEMGRVAVAGEGLVRELERTDRDADPLHYARLQLLHIVAMRWLAAPGWQDLADDTVALLERQQAPRELAQALQLRAIAATLAGRADQATRDYLRARELFAELLDEVAVARVTNNLAHLAMRDGRATEALAQFEHCVTVFETYGAVRQLLSSLRSIAYIHSSMLRHEAALQATERLRPLLLTSADAVERLDYLERRAAAMIGLGRLREAQALLDEIRRDLHRDEFTDEDRLVAAILQARLSIAQGDWPTAIDIADAGFELAYTPGRAGDFETMREKGELALYLGLRAREESETWQQSATLPPLSAHQRAALDTASHGHGLLARAIDAGRRGDFAAAERDYRAALQAPDAGIWQWRMLDATSALIDFLLAQGRAGDAAVELDRLLARDPALPEHDYGAAALVLRVRLATGDTGRWPSAARRVQVLAGERRPPAELMSAILTVQTAAAQH